MERDVAILKKMLNSPLFLNKFPVIKRVSVDKFGEYVDIVMIPHNMDEYFKFATKIFDYVWELKRATGVESKITLYP
jgi:hypothetical protein